MLSNILVIILNIFIAKIQAWPPLPGKTVGDIFVHDPSMIKKGNEYWLYYSTSTFGTQNSCIYMATSKNLISWSNKGKIICSRKGSEYNAIDPNIVKDLNGEL